jgi:Domain of unknown function (DUF4352)
LGTVTVAPAARSNPVPAVTPEDPRSDALADVFLTTSDRGGMMRTATKASVSGAIALSATFLVGPVGASSANADLDTQKKAKRCATTGTYVKPGSTKPKNSGKNNPGKLFKGRPGQDSGDQERNTGETANLGGFAATVTSASFEQSLSTFENDGYLRVSVKVCNRNSDTNDESPLDWKLQTPNGNRIDITSTSAPTLQGGTLVGGGEQAGDVYFPVDGQNGDFYVIFKPLSDPFGDERGIWKVSI